MKVRTKSQSIKAKDVKPGEVIRSDFNLYLRLLDVSEKTNGLKFASLVTGQVTEFGTLVPCFPVTGEFVEQGAV